MVIGKRTLLVTGLIAGLSWIGNAQDNEVKVKMKDLPAAVQKAVQEQSKGATLHGLSKEVEGGKTFYEAELKVNGHGRDVLIDPAGAVVEVEEEVALAAVSGPVKAGVQKAAAGAKLIKLESITRNNTLAAYEVTVRKGGKTSEVKLSPDGSLMEK
jgi:uncharacterized membrane protein YkoI